MDFLLGACHRYTILYKRLSVSIMLYSLFSFLKKMCLLIIIQDFLGDDFKSQGSHVPYNVADFSTQVHIKESKMVLEHLIIPYLSYCELKT